LKQQEEELGYFHKEMDGMKNDIDDLKKSLDTGLRKIDVVNTGLAQALMLLGTNLEEISGLSEHLVDVEEDGVGPDGKKKSKKEKKAEAKAKKEEEKKRKELDKEKEKAKAKEEEALSDEEGTKEAAEDVDEDDEKTPGA
jgi:hypothetical protein